MLFLRHAVFCDLRIGSCWACFITTERFLIIGAELHNWGNFTLLQLAEPVASLLIFKTLNHSFARLEFLQTFQKMEFFGPTRLRGICQVNCVKPAADVCRLPVLPAARVQTRFHVQIRGRMRVGFLRGVHPSFSSLNLPTNQRFGDSRRASI